MSKKYKPVAYAYEDGDGYFTLHCPTIESAQKEIQEAVNEDFNFKENGEPAENLIVVNIRDIKIQRMYKHRDCDGWSIGEPLCWDCGEATSTQGRQTFTFEY